MHLVILGGNSDIGLAIAHKYAQVKGAHITLASRSLEELQKKAQDIEIRYLVNASAKYFDITDYQSHEEFYQGLEPKPDGVVLACGYTNDQVIAQRSFNEAFKSISVNYIGAVGILEIVARDFERKGRGFIIGISSVAGDRGRQANYIYGSAKSGLSTYLSGLRNRLHTANVQVLTVKPGFVRTKMTKDKDLPEKLVAEPEDTARDIFQAQQKGKGVIYTKWFWRYIMLIIRLIPEKIFVKTDI